MTANIALSVDSRPDQSALDRLQLIQDAQLDLYERVERLEHELGGASKPEHEDRYTIIWGLIREAIREIRKTLDEARALELEDHAEAVVLKEAIKAAKADKQLADTAREPFE